MRRVSTGVETERQAAYEIDFYAGHSKNLFVIHDLRLEIGGRVAQIDHVLMNRAFEVFVLETKTYGTGLSINERGEFSTVYDGKEVGIPSPVEQNARHISVLKDAFKEIGLPKRLGITMQPSFNSVVLVSPKAVITRPKAATLDASIIKLDQFISWYHQEMDKFKASDILGMFKVCSSRTVRELGEKLLALHTPIRIDYVKKFELESALLDKDGQADVHVEKPFDPPAMAQHGNPEVQYFCADCKASIAAVVAKFCWNNKARFHGRAYCRVCQSKFATAKAAVS